MPDITMCDGKGCDIRETCFRFKAKASINQSYFIRAPYDKKKKTCDSKLNLNKYINK